MPQVSGSEINVHYQYFGLKLKSSPVIYTGPRGCKIIPKNMQRTFALVRIENSWRDDIISKNSY